MTNPRQREHDGQDNERLLPVIDTLPARNSPLLVLNEIVKVVFQRGPDSAFSIYRDIQKRIAESREGSHTSIDDTLELELLSRIFGPNMNANTYWRSSTAAATFVLLFACSNNAETMHALVKDRGRTFGGLPSYELIQNTPSTSLPLAFHRAKSAALETGQTTVMVVSLHDVHYLHLAARDELGDCFTFSHIFTVGVGPEGMIIWQAWGPNGYGLDKYIRDKHTRLRSWDESEQFIDDFDRLTHGKGTWTAHINELYKKLFLVDINQICGPDGPEPPVTPEFKPWVRIRVFDNVSYEDVIKFCLKLTTQYVEPEGEAKETIDRIHEEYWPLLFRGNEPGCEKENYNSGRPSARINAAVWRELDTVAWNPNDAELTGIYDECPHLRPKIEQSSSRNNPTITPGTSEWMSDYDEHHHGNDNHEKDGWETPVVGKSVRMKVVDVKALINEHRGGGLKEIHERTAMDRAIPFSARRIANILFHVDKSPS
ncbi:hypothetical protein BJ170DRAFT_731149 [Xylariales sp. AK1849]|nr:hypothetical protein BJ170DRAFT_731149 [Xylariales sp. AK1849]